VDAEPSCSAAAVRTELVRLALGRLIGERPSPVVHSRISSLGARIRLSGAFLCRTLSIAPRPAAHPCGMPERVNDFETSGSGI
jgi:hypothetical protein